MQEKDLITQQSYAVKSYYEAFYASEMFVEIIVILLLLLFNIVCSIDFISIAIFCKIGPYLIWILYRIC